MSTQPEALRLAEYWTKRANDLQTWVDENDYVEFGYRPEGLKREQADQRRTAAELRRLHALNAELLDALLTAMPFVEDAADDEIYKSHRVHQILKNIRAAIAKAGGETK